MVHAAASDRKLLYRHSGGQTFSAPALPDTVSQAEHIWPRPGVNRVFWSSLMENQSPMTAATVTSYSVSQPYSIGDAPGSNHSDVSTISPSQSIGLINGK